MRPNCAHDCEHEPSPRHLAQSPRLRHVAQAMALTQLNPTLPVEIDGKGKGLAFAVIDYSEEHHLLWIVALDDGGEIWAAPNPAVRMQANWSFGRKSANQPAGARV